MKRKLVFVARALWIGGVEISLVNLINSLDYEKYDVTCLVTCAEIQLLERIDKRCRVVVCDRGDSGYRYQRLHGLGQIPDHPSHLHAMLIWTAPMFRALENRLYARYIRQTLNQKFDIAIIYDVYVAELAVRGVSAEKYLMFYHHGAMGHAYHDEIGYRKSEKIIVVSKALCIQMKVRNPQYADKMLPIHNIIDVDRILSGAQESIPMEGVFKIVSCGRLSYEKGMDIAVKAAFELVKKGYHDYIWYIVGGGREAQNLTAQVKALGLEQFVKLVGEKSNPYPYMNQADLFVQTSRKEAYGLSLVEALLLNTPVVATKTIGAEEVLESGKYGLLTDFAPESVASGVEKLMRDVQVRLDYQERAKLSAIRDQNSENLKKICELLDEQ